MTNTDLGPPERERPGPHPGTGPIQKSAGTTHTDKPKVTTRDRPRGGDTGLARRRGASRRMPPLGPCGCVRDPAHDGHRCGGEITDKTVVGAVEAAHHLADLGYPPIFNVEMLRAMWKAGHHRLVDDLREVG